MKLRDYQNTDKHEKIFIPNKLFLYYFIVCLSNCSSTDRYPQFLHNVTNNIFFMTLKMRIYSNDQSHINFIPMCHIFLICVSLSLSLSLSIFRFIEFHDTIKPDHMFIPTCKVMMQFRIIHIRRH